MTPRFYIIEDEGFELVVNKRHLFKLDEKGVIYCGTIDRSWSPAGRPYVAYPYSWYLHNDYIKKIVDYYDEKM